MHLEVAGSAEGVVLLREDLVERAQVGVLGAEHPRLGVHVAQGAAQNVDAVLELLVLGRLPVQGLRADQAFQVSLRLQSGDRRLVGNRGEAFGSNVE
eukprot:3554958-Lingulodinium_polyedra.AAC.1